MKTAIQQAFKRKLTCPNYKSVKVHLAFNE